MVRVFRPESLGEALSIRSTGKTVLMAGGTDLMVKHRALAGTLPSFDGDILHVAHLKELCGIAVEGDHAEIGSAAALSDILAHKRIPDEIKLPISQIGSPAIRNVATLGGNICNASPAGDSLPMLYALGAVLTIRSLKRTRTCRVADFVEGPGRTTLMNDEILTSITIPLKPWSLFFYRKAGQRKANAVAKLSFFGVCKTEGKQIRDIRMAFGAVAPTVIRSEEAERILSGCSSRGPDDAKREALSILGRALSPIDDIRSNKDYRFKVSMRLAARFIEEVLCV